MGIPDHLTCLLRNLYAGQQATVRTGHGTTDWFQIGKGNRGYLGWFWLLGLQEFTFCGEQVSFSPIPYVFPDEPPSADTLRATAVSSQSLCSPIIILLPEWRSRDNLLSVIAMCVVLLTLEVACSSWIFFFFCPLLPSDRNTDHLPLLSYIQLVTRSSLS